VYGNNTAAGTATADATYAGDSNHNSSTATQKTFTIDKASSSTVITCPSSVTYTGSALTPCSATATGVGSLSVSVSVVYGNNTNAGTATADATYAGDANHNGSAATQKTFTIGQAGSTTVVTCAAGPFTYTGSAQTPCSVSVTGAGALNLTPAPEYTDNINAGLVTASYTFTGDANHTGSSDSDTFTIGKADADIVVTPYSVTYDGSAHTATGSATGVLDEALSGLDLSGTTHTDAGLYNGDTWTFTDVTGNYNDATGTVDDSIAKADAIIDVTPYDVTYDANPHTATGTATGVNSESLSGLDLSGTTHTNAGTYNDTWTFTDSTGNYNDATGSVTDKIAKANAVIDVTPYDVTYDGNPHTATGTATGVNDEDLSSLLNLSGTTHTNAGLYTGDAWSFAGDDNYSAANGTVDDNIDKADATIDVTPYDVTYDGNEHTATGTATGVNGEDLSSLLDLSGTAHTDAGLYTGDSWSFAGNDNYNEANGTVDDNISKANAVISVNGFSGPYDGLAHGATGSVTGVESVPADLTSLLHLGTSFTNVPGGTANWTFDGNNNYNEASGSAAINIGKVNAHITVNGYSDIYDGAPHGATGSASGVEVIPADLSGLLHLGDSFTNVPGGTANWTFDGNGNYNAASGDVNIEISKADADISVTPYSVTYDANSHTSTGTAKGVLDEDLSGLDLSGTAHTNAGSFTDTWTFTDSTGNYNDDSGSVDNSIAKADAVCSVNGYSVTYDTAAHTATGSCLGVEGETLAGLDLSGTTHTAAGSYTDTWTFTDSTGNYEGQSSTVSDSIGKATPVITWANPADIVYNAGLSAAELNATASVPGSFVYTPANGTVLNAGMGQSLHVDFTPTDTANYNNASKNVSINVLKAASTTAVTCPASVTYNGSAQTPCSASVTGAGGLSQALTVSYLNNTNAGTATASASFAGDANHNSSSDSKTFTISAAPSTTVVTCPTNVTYNGSTQTPCSASVSGAGGLSQVLTVNYINNTNAGTATASASFAGDANHNSSSDSKNFTIDQAASTTTVTCPASVTYNGSAQTPCSALATGVGGLSQALTVSYVNNTNAGSATANASFAGDANHTGSNGTKNFTINKALPTLTVTGGSYLFDGNSHPATATAKGIGGVVIMGSFSFTYNGSATAPVNVGTYSVSASFTSSNPNYDNAVAINSATITIGAWMLKGFYAPVDMNGVFNTVKSGSTVPLKFEVFSGNTEFTDVGAIKSLTYGQIACVVSAPVDEIETTATGSTALRYDSTAGQFIYNWKTSGAAGTCLRVTLTTDDGSVLQAYFKLK
jgi:hypothetical protein